MESHSFLSSDQHNTSNSNSGTNHFHIPNLILNEKLNLKPYQKIKGYQELIQSNVLSSAGFFLTD